MSIAKWRKVCETFQRKLDCHSLSEGFNTDNKVAASMTQHTLILPSCKYDRRGIWSSKCLLVGTLSLSPVWNTALFCYRKCPEPRFSKPYGFAPPTCWYLSTDFSVYIYLVWANKVDLKWVTLAVLFITWRLSCVNPNRELTTLNFNDKIFSLVFVTYMFSETTKWILNDN